MNLKTNDIKSNIEITIGSLSSAINVSQRTLRIYDKEGILTPKRKNNRRCYTFDDCRKVKLILFLTRNLAINLSGVKIILLLLEKNNVESKQYVEFVDNIAKMANISICRQKVNIEKNLKRGRPKLNKTERY